MKLRREIIATSLILFCASTSADWWDGWNDGSGSAQSYGNAQGNTQGSGNATGDYRGTGRGWGYGKGDADAEVDFSLSFKGKGRTDMDTAASLTGNTRGSGVTAGNWSGQGNSAGNFQGNGYSQSEGSEYKGYGSDIPWGNNRRSNQRRANAFPPTPYTTPYPSMIRPYSMSPSYGSSPGFQQMRAQMEMQRRQHEAYTKRMIEQQKAQMEAYKKAQMTMQPAKSSKK